MARKIYPYSLESRGREDRRGLLDPRRRSSGIDPTFLRIGFVAAALFISFEVDAGRLCRDRHLPRDPEEAGGDGRAAQERLRAHGRCRRRASRRSTRCATDLDANDRRLMAIDHHLSTPNEELAREIEALAGGKVMDR